MDRGKGVEKIRGEKHKSSEAKHILGRMKSNSDFIERGQLHCDILWEGRNTRKKKKTLSFASYKNRIAIFGASHCWIFLTHNTSKLRNLVQNFRYIGLSHP